MKKQRVNTTISKKHHEILKKHAEKYGTQQSVLEHALDGLENNSNHDSELSPEQKLWIKVGIELKEIHILFQRDLTKILFETMDIRRYKEYIKNKRPGEFAVEWYYNKPLKECTLKEIIDAIIIKLKVQGGADTLNFTEDENSYKINMTHSMGINCSKMIVILDESVFKSYGVKYESHYSERSIFFKIFK